MSESDVHDLERSLSRVQQDLTTVSVQQTGVMSRMNLYASLAGTVVTALFIVWSWHINTEYHPGTTKLVKEAIGAVEEKMTLDDQREERVLSAIATFSAKQQNMVEMLAEVRAEMKRKHEQYDIHIHQGQ